MTPRRRQLQGLGKCLADIRSCRRRRRLTFSRRLARGVSLTAAGTEALRIARHCIADTQALRTAVQAAAGGETGLLRVGFVGSATYSLMPKLLPAFRQRFPKVELELRESTNVELLAMVEASQLDIGLVRYPTASASSLRFDVLERDVFAAVLPAAHPLLKCKRLTLAQIAQEPLIELQSQGCGSTKP